MALVRERPAPSERWGPGLLGGVLASVGYAALVVGYSSQSPDVQLTGAVWSSFGLAVGFAFGTIGVPVLLWMRYRIRGPAVLMALVLLFWHVLIRLPAVGASGDTPAFALVLFWAPLYLAAYGLLAGGEYWLRERRGSLPIRRA